MIKTLEDVTPAHEIIINHKAAVELARRYAEEKDILNWGRVLFPKKFNLPFCQEMHGYFCEIRKESLTNTEAPRGSGKTLIKCFLIPLFQALNEPEIFNHYLNVQSTDSKVLTVNRTVKGELERNEELIDLYEYQIGDRWTDQQFVLKNGIAFTAASAGQSIRGINYDNRRPDYIILDDLYNVEEDMNNPESTIKKNEWFWGTLYPSRSFSKNSSVHIQGTAVNSWDILESLKSNKQWISRTFKSIKDLDKKEVLWKEFKTFDSLLLDRESMGSSIFFREMQNERGDTKDSKVKSEWLTEWEYDPAELKFDSYLKLSEILLGVDPSIGETGDSDYTGMVLILKTVYSDGSGNNYWIDSIWNEHLSMDGRIKFLERIQANLKEGLKITKANIEGIAGFKDFVAEVRRRTNLPVHEISAVKNKLTNLELKSHYFENKKIKINKNIDPPLKDLLRYQLTTNYPKHDDLRDALLLCLDDKPGVRITVL